LVENSSSDKLNSVDKEVDILLKEFEMIRAESLTRETSRTQLLGAAGVLIGALTVLSPLVITVNNQGLLALKVPLPYFILALLVVSLLFTSLQSHYLLQDFEVGNIAIRCNRIRSSICSLLGLPVDTSPVLNWDREHIKMINPSTPIAYITSATLSLSRYVVLSLPAFASLTAAIWIYYANLSSLPAGVFVWITVFFIFFDLVYFLMIFPSGWYVYRVYLKLRK
jgi:hypothetical protein